MLTKDMKRTLDFVNSSNPDVQDRFYSVESVASNLSFSFMKSLAVCESLEKEGYIVFDSRFKNFFRPLEKGINYKDLSRQDLMKFLNRSVIIPFFVSLATSLITMGIADLIN